MKEQACTVHKATQLIVNSLCKEQSLELKGEKLTCDLDLDGWDGFTE